MLPGCSDASDTPVSWTMSEIESVSPPAVVVNERDAWMSMSAIRTLPDKSW